MYNDSLKSQVEANRLAITALQSQLETVAADVEKTDKDIQMRFKAHIHFANADYPYIPTKMMDSLQTHISSSHIRIMWNRYDNPARTNDIDIYYYSNKEWQNKAADGNHRWEISCSSNRLIVNTTEAGWAQQTGEDIDKAKLSLGLFEIINRTSKHIIEYHKKYSENQNRASELRYAIEKLERGIKEAEEQMSYNTYLRMFKPGGDTAIILKNKDIPAAPGACYYASKRNHIYFNAVNLVKESTKRGIRVEFIRYSEATAENGERQRWVQDTKWLLIGELVSLFRKAQQDYDYKLQRDAEREERRLALENKEV
jgi:hypothetical protein